MQIFHMQSFGCKVYGMLKCSFWESLGNCCAVFVSNFVLLWGYSLCSILYSFGGISVQALGNFVQKNEQILGSFFADFGELRCTYLVQNFVLPYRVFVGGVCVESVQIG
ncbi:hypothetical protein U1Q18_032922 [Sarracenia purpurea var. burkii]